MKKIITTRYLLVLSTFTLSLLLYIDRVCISAAKGPISESLHLNDQQMGWVLSIFALGYAVFQTPGGLLSDRLGPRIALGSIVCFWSFFTALTGAAWNFVSLLIVRLLFGAGEAGAFPGISRAMYSWFPLKERGIINGINFSGSRLGAAFALPFVAWMISATGWRVSFFILGAIGIVWAVIWYWWFRNTPEEHPNISDDEKKYILKYRQQAKDMQSKSAAISFSIIFGSDNVWLAMAQYFASNFTFFFCLTWLLPHLKLKYELALIDAGILASIPLIFGALGNYFSGWLVDKLYKQGTWTQSRRVPAMIGFILAAFGLIGSVYMSNIFGSVLFLSIAIFGADMTLSPSWAFCIDIGKTSAGVVSGTMNMAGNIGSFVTALAFPYLKAWTGSVTPFFLIGAGLNIVAAILWLRMNPEKSLI
ncbi:MFS transporter [candidate division KSB1 bacterium]|nr:MFS transporter [candidate division KSB1 bacterium]